MSRIRLRRVPRAWRVTALVAILAVVASLTGAIALHGKTGDSARNPMTTELVESLQIPAIRKDTGTAALFVGDSYTMGPYALSDLGYACLTAANMRWQCNLGNQAASGYIAGGEGQRLPSVVGAPVASSTSINERFAHLRELYEADIVVLDGGRNDLRFGVFYLRNMLMYSVQRAIEAWPNARIVVILPWLISDPKLLIPDTDITFNSYLTDELRKDPQFDAVTIIDPAALGWFQGADAGLTQPDADADGIHPNFAGHRKVAEYLTAALQQNGFESAQ